MLSGHDIDEWEPRILPDVLGSVAGVSVYDDLGSQYKLNVSYRGFNSGPTSGCRRALRSFSTVCGRTRPMRRRSTSIAADGAREARGALERHGFAAWTELARRRDQSRDGSRRGAAARRVEASGGSFGMAEAGGDRRRESDERMGLLSRRRLRARGWMA